MKNYPSEFLRYAVFYLTLRAYRNDYLLSIREIKETIKKDYCISEDAMNRFIPEKDFKKINENLPGLKPIPKNKISETLLIPSDIPLMTSYVEIYHAKSIIYAETKKINEPELREMENKPSPNLNKIWKKIKANA